MKKYLFALLTATLFTSAYADQPKVYTRDSVVFNRTFADWSVAWRQWAESMPASFHPLFDQPLAPGHTPAPCSEGQSGPVWFIGGRFCATPPPPGTTCNSELIERSCDIPEGVALYFPVLNSGCLDVEAAHGHCQALSPVSAGPFISQMRKEIAGGIDQVTGLYVSVDGNSINGNLRNDFRVQSNVYTTLVPEGNLFQEIGEPEVIKGTYVGVDDGIYVMLKPLRKGHHELVFRGSFLPAFPFTLDATYHLNVQ
jgi:hypothetical protein